MASNDRQQQITNLILSVLSYITRILIIFLMVYQQEVFCYENIKVSGVLHAKLVEYMADEI